MTRRQSTVRSHCTVCGEDGHPFKAEHMQARHPEYAFIRAPDTKGGYSYTCAACGIRPGGLIDMVSHYQNRHPELISQVSPSETSSNGYSIESVVDVISYLNEKTKKLQEERDTFEGLLKIAEDALTTEVGNNKADKERVEALEQLLVKEQEKSVAHFQGRRKANEMLRQIQEDMARENRRR